MSQWGGFAYIEVTALAFCAPWSLYIGDDTKKGDPRCEGDEKGARVERLGTFSIDFCTLLVIFNTSEIYGNKTHASCGLP
jgi:hypothetical protein